MLLRGPPWRATDGGKPTGSPGALQPKGVEHSTSADGLSMLQAARLHATSVICKDELFRVSMLFFFLVMLRIQHTFS